MYSVHDIADYVILQAKAEDSNTLLINLKLQKLLYYIQAWSYGIRNEALFEGKFQAWIHGPVNREIYDRFASTKTLYSEIELEDCRNKNIQLQDNDAKFVNFILENYMQYSGAELEMMTHSEKPWRITRGNLGPYERCEKIIEPDLLKEYYGQRWEAIQSRSASR